MSVELLMVLTTSDDRAELDRIAAELVKQRLAACCQISGPISSHYVWDGELCQTEEWVCRIKTTRSAFESLSGEIKRLHHYGIPQIVATELISVDPEYRDWVCENVD